MQPAEIRAVLSRTDWDIKRVWLSHGHCIERPPQNGDLKPIITIDFAPEAQDSDMVGLCEITVRSGHRWEDGDGAYGYDYNFVLARYLALAHSIVYLELEPSQKLK